MAGVAGASTAAALTSNATIAAAIGLGVNSLASEGLKYVERRIHRFEQQTIAQAAGPLAPGAVAPWSVEHTLPIEDDAQGQVVVSRAFGALGFLCKEIVFSIDKTSKDGVARSFYTATICQDGPAWRWASAEPSTERWGGLQ